jgi:hypothetical protein
VIRTASLGRALSVVALVIGLLAGTAAMAGAAGSTGARATELPSAAHLIVGPSIKLPAALFASAAPGTVPLVTPIQAKAVVPALWRAWENALISDNTQALTQLVAPGPVRSGELSTCALAPRCVEETKPRPLEEVQLAVPIQTKYPIDFLAEIRTTYNTTLSNGLTREEPWVELQVYTKASAAAPWQLGFDTGYGNDDGSRPTLIPFELEPHFSTVPGQNLYNGPATWTPPEPADRFIPLLAQYWQSWKDTRHAPADTDFVPGGYTTGVGQGLRTPRQGSIHLGSRQTFRFSPDAAAGKWEFTVTGSAPMVCGAIVDKVTSTAVNGKGLMQQNADEHNYGIPLAPGVYKQTTLYLDHETCIQAGSDGLGVWGNITYASNSTGIRANPVLEDFETNLGVLADDIAQHRQAYDICKKTKSVTVCTEQYGKDVEAEFAGFLRALTGIERFPTRVGGQVARIAATTRKLALLFEQIGNSGNTPALKSKLHVQIRSFDNESNALIKALA